MGRGRDGSGYGWVGLKWVVVGMGWGTDGFGKGMGWGRDGLGMGWVGVGMG